MASLPALSPASTSNPCTTKHNLAPSPFPLVEYVSRSTVKPLLPPLTATTTGKTCSLTPWDLNRLAQPYMHVGFTFSKDQHKISPEAIVDNLQSSLALALFYFYPVAGRLVAHEEIDTKTKQPNTCISLSCNGEGVEFTHATAHRVDVGRVCSPFADPRSLLQGLFPLNGAVNYDGLHMPQFAAQLTELADGFFLGCSFSHTVGDGASFTHFLRSWAELSRAKAAGVDARISCPPVFGHWFDKDTKRIKMPNFNEKETIARYFPSKISQRLFHFSPDGLHRLTERAKKESNIEGISSFQALLALVWRCTTRARGTAEEQKMSCWMGIDNRPRIKPRLSRNYFGNASDCVASMLRAEDLLKSNGLGRCAQLLQQRLVSHNDNTIRALLKKWMTKPIIDPINPSVHDPYSILNSGSSRFDAYNRADFGFGLPIGLRSGESNWFDGSVTWWPGHEGRRSVELEICLSPEAMEALESDPEFMDYVSLPVPLPVPNRGLPPPFHKQ